MGLSSEDAGGKTESCDYAVRVYHQRRLEAVDPLRLGGAPPEGGLPAEEPLARSPHPHHRRDERRVHHAIDGRRTGELSGEGLRKRRILGSRARIRRLVALEQRLGK